MVDMYIDNSEPSENVGQIHFSLEYDFQNTTLILKVIQVSDILVKRGKGEGGGGVSERTFEFFGSWTMWRACVGAKDNILICLS